MLHSAAFHLGLHCLIKSLFRGFRYIKGKVNFHLQMLDITDKERSGSVVERSA